MPSIHAPLSALRSLSRLPLRISSRSPIATGSFRPALSSLISRRAARYQSTKPLTEKPASASSQSTHQPKPTRPPQPEYEMTFTCKPCGTRSTHRLSKQGYHYGSTLITCPECRNRHIISDHLNIFGDKHMTIEDLMRERGQLVKKGTLSEDGDLEFWEDGTTTKRTARKEDETSKTPRGLE